MITNLENDRFNDFINKQKKLTSSIRTATIGSKVVRIEIYDADQFDDSTKSVCNCNAEICAQHVVQNIFSDNIYTRVKDILKSIETSLLSLPL